MSLEEHDDQRLLNLHSVLKVIAYFDLFDHPLTTWEVWQFLDQSLSLQETNQLLQTLAKLEVLQSKNDFWGIINLDQNISRRRKKNQLAIERTKAVKRFSRIIAAFPYVRSVCLTGSYSKGVMSEDSDLDFLIIMKPGRLWYSKMLMVLFRKIFLLDSHRNFCINYLVTQDNLYIKSQNIFTAMELVTMIPAYGFEVYEELMAKNKWLDKIFPNFSKSQQHLSVKLNWGQRTFKSLIEKISSYPWADKIDRHFMKLSLTKYRSKYGGDLSEEDFMRAIEVSPMVSKVHPQFFQKRIQIQLQEKFDELTREVKVKAV